MNLEYKELTDILYDYIRNQYEYDYADVFEDCITLHYEDGKTINVYVQIEDCEED